MSVVKKSILGIIAAVFLGFAGYYAWWSLFFFPDDYQVTRAEAEVRGASDGSRTIDVSLIDLVDSAKTRGIPGPEDMEALAVKLRGKGYLLKEDAYIAAARRHLVRRAGTGFPGIWVDERSSLVLPGKSSLAFRVSPGKKAVLEFSAISFNGDGTLRVTVRDGAGKGAPGEYSLEHHRPSLTAADVPMKKNNRGYPRAKDDPGWREYSLDLSRWEGKRISLEFAYESDGGVAFVANPRIFSSSEERRYNVIYIIFDGVSTRHFSFYNPDSSLTPFMKQKADEEFIVFDNMFSLGDKTRISTAGLFCSIFPFLTRHGINRNFIPREEIDLFYREVLSGRISALPDHFRKAGYISNQIGNSGFTVQMISTGVDYGFDSSYEFSGNPYDSYALARRFFEFSRKNREREFFTYLHFNTPHKPFNAPAHHFLKGLINSPLASLWRPDFMGCISYTDDVFKNLYRHLEVQGLLENSIIVVATDHGAGFDLSKFDAGFQYVDFTRMAFMVRLPRELKKRLGSEVKRAGAYVSSINTAPTLCELAGVDVPKAFRGKSFVSLLAGKHEGDFFDREVWSFGRKALSVITDDHFRYIFTSADEKRYVNRSFAVFGTEREVPFEQIYHLKSDPLETVNLVNRRHDVLASFRKLFYDADIHHPERNILAFAAPDGKKRIIEVRVKSASPVLQAALFSEKIEEKEKLGGRVFGGNTVFRFSMEEEVLYMVLELKDDRAPLEILISENGKKVPDERILSTYLDLNFFKNPIRLSGRKDFLILASPEMPAVPESRLKGTNGITVKISRMDLHRWIDVGMLEQKGITAGMKETLKSWGYIQ